MKKGFETVLNLSNYPLDELTPTEFTALVAVLERNQFLTHLYLDNCGLAKLKPHNLNALLAGLNHLVGLSLHDNQLSHSSESLKAVYHALHSLPQFYFLSIGEVKEHQRVPEFFSGLRTLPAFRMYKEDASISFLKGAEIDTLFEFMETNSDYIRHYFSEPYHISDDPSSSKNPFIAFIKTQTNLKKAQNYRYECSENLVVIPRNTLKALEFFDELEGSGVAMRYCTTKKAFILNLQQTTDASCARVAFILQQSLPKDIRWHLELPDRPVSHFTIDAFLDLEKKYPNVTMIRTTKCVLEKSILPHETTADYTYLKLLNDCFVQGNEPFYELLNDEEILFQVFDRLRSILESGNNESKNLVYEFFVVHQLCIIGEIKDLQSLNTIIATAAEKPLELDEKLDDFKKKILSLLNSDSRAVAEQLKEVPKDIAPPLTNEVKDKDKNNERKDEGKVKERESLYAKAWWGKAAFYQINQNSSMGIYCYGLCLQKYPYPDRSLSISLSEPRTYQAEKRGLYWLRLAATNYQNPYAINYLNDMLPRQAILSPPDRYQLLLAAEELKLPFPTGGLFSSYQYLLQLIPERSFLSRMRDLSEEAASNSNFVGFTNLTSRYLNIDPNVDWLLGASLGLIVRAISAPSLSKKSDTDFFLREQEFYISSLMADNLLPERTKVHLFKRLFKDRGEVIASIELSSVRDLPELREQLIHYYKTPLGKQLNEQVLPILNVLLKQGKTYELNSQIPIGRNSLGLREVVFCQFFKKHLDNYLQHRKLFNVDIAKNESPGYVAALIHSLLIYSLDYFELDDSKLKDALNQVMQEIKKELQEHVFRHNLMTHPNSFGFQEAMTRRLTSYSTTGYVANTAKLSPLRTFGEQHKSIESHDEDWVKKGLHTSALGIEALHVAVPVVLAVTGVGLPAALGSSVVFEGLRLALEQIHHYAHLTEHVLHEYEGATDLVVKLTHMYHLSHESVLSSHGHSAPRMHVELDTIQHLNNLLSSAAVNDIDIIPVLMRHWATVYRPITDELTETSNTLLGTLLVELLMRSLTVRLLAEKQDVFRRRAELPRNISGLLDYFNETLWLYCRPNLSDDTQLLTKKRNVLSALDIIFPQQLMAYFSGQVIDVAIRPKNIPPRMPLTREGTPCRFASDYEVKQLNALSNGNSQKGFELADGGHNLFVEWRNLDIVIAYQESATLNGKISLLSNKAELSQLQIGVNNCIHYNNFIINFKKLPPSDARNLELVTGQLLTLTAILENSISKLDNPAMDIDNTIDNMPKLVFMDSTLSPKAAIRAYLEKATAFFILLDRKYKMNLDVIKHIPLAKMETPHLERLLGPTLKVLGLQESSLLALEGSVTNGGFFKPGKDVLVLKTQGSQHELNM